MTSCSDKKIIVAVDGFSSSGKSTFAREIAARLGYIFIDTGAMYRAVTLYALRNEALSGGEIDPGRVIALLPDVHIAFRFNPQRQASDLYLNGENVEEEIRRIEVSNRVSRVSSIAEVREQLVRMQQEMGRDKGVVMDGRDIGTVVFPAAELKIFVTADPAVRARRRHAELAAKGQSVSLEEIEKNIRERDHADQTREISPLRQAEGAVVLDTTDMTPESELEWFMELFRQRAC